MAGLYFMAQFLYWACFFVVFCVDNLMSDELKNILQLHWSYLSWHSFTCCIISPRYMYSSNRVKSYHLVPRHCKNQWLLLRELDKICISLNLNQSTYCNLKMLLKSSSATAMFRPQCVNPSTPGNTWGYTHHCGYSCPGAEALCFTYYMLHQ